MLVLSRQPKQPARNLIAIYAKHRARFRIGGAPVDEAKQARVHNWCPDGHAATCSAAEIAESKAASDLRLAPTGSGFRSDNFHRLKVVGCTFAARHASLIESPAAFARASSCAMIVCWSMGLHDSSNRANSQAEIAT